MPLFVVIYYQQNNLPITLSSWSKIGIVLMSCFTMSAKQSWSDCKGEIPKTFGRITSATGVVFGRKRSKHVNSCCFAVSRSLLFFSLSISPSLLYFSLSSLLVPLKNDFSAQRYANNHAPKTLPVPCALGPQTPTTATTVNKKIHY